MPIYEYICGACDRKSDIFFRSIGMAEENPKCQLCGERKLRRTVSRVWSRRSSPDDDFLEPSHEEEGVPFYGGDPSSYGADEGGGEGDYDEGSDAYGEEDVAAFAREARQMAQMMGDPPDNDLDSALRHIEGGADPEDVLGDLDAKSTQPSTDESGSSGLSEGEPD